MRLLDDYMREESFSEKVQLAKSKYEEVFGSSDGATFTLTPASMILLGDHTHYNDGILLSAALNKYSIIIIRKRKDNLVKIFNADNGNFIEFSLNEIPEEKSIDFKYHIGLTKLFKKNYLINRGFECLFSSDIPECLGIGKYSSMETGFAIALKKSFRQKIETEKLFDLIHENELNLIGKISNKAHYYTSLYSKKNKLLFYDVRSKEFKTVPLKDNFEIVILNTDEKINNPLNTCNERIDECEVGVKGLRLYIWGIKNLRDVGLDFLLRHYHMLPKRIFNRVLYNVKERERVERAIASIRENSYDKFGKCIFESHWSMSQDYELSCESCDFIVSKSLEKEYVIGSKMISCTSLRSTYHIVRKDSSQNFIDYIQHLYNEKYNRELKSYVFNFSDGIKECTIKKLETVI